DVYKRQLAVFLSPDGADQREAAIVRRLDRLTRAVRRLERDVNVGNEALALFVKFWLTTGSKTSSPIQLLPPHVANEFLHAIGIGLSFQNGQHLLVLVAIAEQPFTSAKENWENQ
ncbi:hypothetical protein ACN4EK_32515, partial [Pantanalinema rosaneae CENA516]